MKEGINIKEKISKRSEIDLTVVIPTYNGASGYLQKTLDSLKCQINTEDISWEVIVVDNNSSDKTALLVKENQRQWPTKYPLRYLFEANQGSFFARKRGVEEAIGEVVAFIDDDNVVANDWIYQVYIFGKKHPKAGAWGGQIHGDFEIKPPKNFNRIASILAIIERGAKEHLYKRRKMVPPGAGLVVRRNAWKTSVYEQSIMNTIDTLLNKDPQSNSDLKMLRYIHKDKWEIWYNPKMHINHQIPKWRLEKRYLMKLSYDIGILRFPLRMLDLKPWQKPLALLFYTLNDMRKILFHIIKYRKSIKTDVVAACEFQLYLNSLLSTFHFMKKKLKDIALTFHGSASQD